MNDYQMHLSISEHFIQSALTNFHKRELLKTEPIEIDESGMMSLRSALAFNRQLTNEFWAAGFNTRTMLCRVVAMTAPGENHTEPIISITEQDRMILDVTM